MVVRIITYTNRRGWYTNERARHCVLVVIFQSTTKREMPYADPEKQREAVKRWQQAHPEKLLAYRKTMFMKNSIAKHRFPKQRSIQFHGLTDAEVIHLVENVLASLRVF